MRRLAVIVVVFGAACGLLGCKGQDSVIVSQGQTADGVVLVDSIYAVSGPSGESAGGRVLLRLRIDQPDRPPVYAEVGGPVTCLAVQGSSAIIRFDEQLSPEQLGVGTVVVHDGNPDTLRGPAFFPGGDPDDCSPTTLPERPLAPGQISIVDTQPPPATR
jgi:hypothetical protein